jgi:hypothetical protein
VKPGPVVADAPAARRWRLVCVGAGLLAVSVTVVAVTLPWFERTSPEDSVTYNPWLWGGPSEQVPGYPSLTVNLIALAVSRQWGLTLVIASSVGALLGLVAAAQPAADPRTRRAVVINVVAAAVSLVVVALAWFAFVADGGVNASTSPAIGVVLALPAQVAWLVLAIIAMRIAARARAAAATASVS